VAFPQNNGRGDLHLGHPGVRLNPVGNVVVFVTGTILMRTTIHWFGAAGLVVGAILGDCVEAVGGHVATARVAVVASPVVVAPTPYVVRRAARYQRRYGVPVAVAVPVGPVGVVGYPYTAVAVGAPLIPVTTWRSPTGFVYRDDYQSNVMPRFQPPASPQTPPETLAVPELEPPAPPADALEAIPAPPAER
jgi:hypothetical protein